jgi:hypothetical protein
MEPATALDWQKHIKAGRQYLKTARNGTARPGVFTNELIYQLTAMAIEQLLVGLWQYHRQMPADHTLEGLVDGLASVCPLESPLADGIKDIGRFDDMCPLVPVKRNPLTDGEISLVLSVGERTAAFALAQVSPQTGGCT